MAFNWNAMVKLNPDYWEELSKQCGKEIRQACFNAHTQRNLRLFLFLRQQIFKYMSVKETIFSSNMAHHIGVYISSPSNERHNGMLAELHPSKIRAIRELRLQRLIIFRGLNACQLKETYEFIRQKTVLVNCAKMKLMFQACTVDVDDLAEFCYHQNEEKRILEVHFLYQTTFRQSLPYLLSTICCVRVFLSITPPCLASVNGTNDLFVNTNRHQNPLEQLEIDYAPRAFYDRLCFDFVMSNIKENGKFAISVKKMPAPASKAQDLAATFGPMNRQLAFHKVNRSNEWGYRSV